MFHQLYDFYSGMYNMNTFNIYSMMGKDKNYLFLYIYKISIIMYLYLHFNLCCIVI